MYNMYNMYNILCLYIYIYLQSDFSYQLDASIMGTSEKHVFQLPASNKTHRERVPLEGPNSQFGDSLYLWLKLLGTLNLINRKCVCQTP